MVWSVFPVDGTTPPVAVLVALRVGWEVAGTAESGLVVWLVEADGFVLPARSPAEELGVLKNVKSAMAKKAMPTQEVNGATIIPPAEPVPRHHR